MRLLTLPSVLLVANLVACAGQQRRTDANLAELRDRASFDLRCDAASLDIVRLDRWIWGVRGCERQATYEGRHCDGAVLAQCNWMIQPASP